MNRDNLIHIFYRFLQLNENEIVMIHLIMDSNAVLCFDYLWCTIESKKGNSDDLRASLTNISSVVHMIWLDS